MIIFPGERLDFVLHANQKTASYYLRAEPIECPNLVETLALIQYDGVQKTIFDLFSNKMLEDGLEVTEVTDGVCVKNKNSPLHY